MVPATHRIRRHLSLALKERLSLFPWFTEFYLSVPSFFTYLCLPFKSLVRSLRSFLTAVVLALVCVYRLDIIREEEGMEVEEDETDVVQLGSAKRSDLQRQQEQEWGAHSVLFATMKKHQRRMVLTTTEEQDKGFHSVFRRDEQTMLQQRLQVLHDDREKDPAFVSDTYAECYPGFGSEVAYLGYDSDEEGEAKDTARVDTGEYRVIPKGKNQQFKSKEEYEKYIAESRARLSRVCGFDGESRSSVAPDCVDT
ncbi:RED family protein N-terminal region protein [Toxoplasma gondii FOU]|uniref:RED family protein N-terminal region protein n=1 Tax=Toxoplasma gondii FOU TaxID=943167 RepID=A0A086LC40_TOXGO|nr:RED family protein N-terminal region protein [Toxoplasma gondii FOU]